MPSRLKAQRRSQTTALLRRESPRLWLDALSIPEGSMMRMTHVTRPDGRRLTVADLPSPDTKRWVIRRKAEVVTAVHAGLLSVEQACSRYSLSLAEFRSWERCIERFGVKGLRTTRTQLYLNFGSAHALSRRRRAR